jgi:hypothetical protein
MTMLLEGDTMQTKTDLTLEQIFNNLVEEFNLEVKPLEIQAYHEEGTEGRIAQRPSYQITYEKTQKHEEIRYSDKVMSATIRGHKTKKTVYCHINVPYVLAYLDLLNKSTNKISKEIIRNSERAAESQKEPGIDRVVITCELQNFRDVKDFLEEQL